MPLVTVILTSYNHAGFLPEAVGSVLEQTFTDFELIVIDDGSSDESQSVLRSYQDSRMRLCLHPENRGPRIGLSEIYPQVRGKYIAMHHSDDAWEKDKLEKQVAFMEKHPEVEVCFTWAQGIDEQGTPYAHEDDPCRVFCQENRSRQEWLRRFFFEGNCLCHPSMMSRRETCAKYSLLDTAGLWQLPDAMGWVRLCKQAEIYIMPEKLTRFRVRRQTQDNTSGDRIDMYIRDAYENHILLREYAGIAESDFLRVFPEAREYVTEAGFDKSFALASICLQSGKISYFADALDMLYGLLQEPESAERLQQFYGYSERDFIAATGRYDAYNVSARFPEMLVSLYYDDGTGYDEEKKITRSVHVTPAGNFIVDFQLRVQPGREVQSLILNINEGHLSRLRLDTVTAADRAVDFKPIGALADDEGMVLFENLHPSYECFVRLKGDSSIHASGNMDIHEEKLWSEYAGRHSKAVAELSRASLERDELAAGLAESRAALRELEDRLGHVQEKYLQEHERLSRTQADLSGLQVAMSSLQAAMSRLQADYDRVWNSRGMRLLRRLYALRDFVLGRGNG